MRARMGGMWFVAILITDVLNPLFIISLGLFVSAGYILTLLMPVTIEIWQAVFWVCTLIPLIGLLAGVYARWKQGVYVRSQVSWRMALPVIPLLVLAPILYGESSVPGLQVWAHADIHLGYIHQLFYGSTPPENIFVAGHPANYYWLYHAYMATVAKITSLHPLYATEIINTITIFSGLLWIAQTLVALKLAKPRTFYLGVAVILVYFAVNITGILTLTAYLADGNAMPNSGNPGDIRITLLEGADRRLHNVLTKVFNVSSMTMGITAFSAVLYVCVRMLKGKIDLLALILISACGIATLAMREIAALYIAVVLLGGLAVTAVIYWMRRPSKGEQILIFWHDLKSRVSPMILSLWFAGSLVLSIPLLKYNMDIYSNFQSPIRVEFFNAANIKMIGAAVLLLIPLFILQGVFVLQKRDRVQYFVQISFLIAVLLTLSLLFPDNNQYKGVYLLAILIAVSALFALQRLQQASRIHWRRLGWMIVTVWFILVFLQIMYASYYALRRAESVALRGFEYDGRHLKYEGELDDRMAAYYWMRENTPTGSIVVLPLEVFSLSNLLHERLLYVKASQYFFTENIAAYDERVNHLEVFYNEDAAMDDYRAVQENIVRNFPEHPIYVVVKDEEVSPEVMKQRGASLVREHAGDGANVYWLNPEAGQ